MGLISISNPSDGETIDAADVATPFTTLKNEFNGNIDNDNVKAAAGILQSKLENAVLGYAEVTANQGSITTETDLTSLSVTVTVPSGGRRVRIKGYGTFQSSVGSDTAVLRIKEGATILQRWETNTGDLGENFMMAPEVILTPSAGSHTYKLAAARTVGTGTITLVASSTDPAFILVETF